MEMRILVTGQNGFLMRNILPALRAYHEVVEFNHTQYSYNGYAGIDLILHFASPSDSYDFKDKVNMAVAMVDLTQAMVNIAERNQCKLVFASSLAADFLQDEYGVYKKAMEQYIQALVEHHLILRLPRIYGKDRTKGLMKKIRLNAVPDEDWDKVIGYADINDFFTWFVENLNKLGIEYYTGEIKHNTIREIKEIYCEF
jgi:nucleoside-diphosphate-sugar epimerase